MKEIAELLQATAAMHHHLCPRQVLGVRMGQYAGELLNLDLPQHDKRLFTIVETDGCAADGVAVATNCSVGRRTLRVEDYGKVAATFVDTLAHTCLRLVPRSTVRDGAWAHAPEAKNRWEAQLVGYERMPCEELFEVQMVELTRPFREFSGRRRPKMTCAQCGEEITNEREVVQDGLILCRACAGPAYYQISGGLPLVIMDAPALLPIGAWKSAGP